MKSTNNFCIILAGGVGKRLWPYSRRSKPKQFLDFFGTGRTLLQHTYDRMAGFIPRENIYISTYSDYTDLVSEQLPQVDADHILAEPVQLSTAPATTWVSYHIASRHPEASIVVTPCDQMILDEERFAQQVSLGLQFVAENDALLSIGVKTTRPNTAYGYIQMGEEVQPNLFTVSSFTEKPDEDYAAKFVESGEFLWNTGLFLWSSKTFMHLVRENMPVLDNFVPKDGKPLTHEQEVEFVSRYYPSTQHRSIDLFVLAKGRRVYVQLCDFGWADIGSWPELHKASHKDGDGNAIIGGNQTLMSGCSDNVVCLPHGMAAVVRGLKGYLIAANDNTLVVCPNDNPALTKKLVNEARMRLGEDFI